MILLVHCQIPFFNILLSIFVSVFITDLGLSFFAMSLSSFGISVIQRGFLLSAPSQLSLVKVIFMPDVCSILQRYEFVIKYYSRSRTVTH